MQKTFILSVLCVLFFAACQQAEQANSIEAKVVGDQTAVAIQAEPSTGTPVQHSIFSQRKIIRKGFMRIETDDYLKTRTAITGLVAQWDAFVAQENEERNHYQQTNRLQIRVPSASFEQLVQSIEGVARSVHQKQIQSQDVTEEYVDLQARLKAKKAAEERYYAFLRKAKNVEEMLQIQAPLRALREEIERVEGRMRYINQQSSLSELEVYLFQNLEPETDPEPVAAGFWHDIKLALKSGADGVGEVVIGLTYLWPIWLLLLSVLFIWWRRRRS